MLYITTAIYPEAAAVLKELPMKKVASRYGAIYLGDSTLLVITGVGSVAAALSVSEALTLYPPGATDLLINYGSCAAPKGSAACGDTFRLHKITEAATGRNFYPDIMFQSRFDEASLVSVPAVSSDPDTLTDMEAAAVYQAGCAFFSPDRMLFYKCVSDFGMTKQASLTPDGLKALLSSHIRAVLSEASAYEYALKAQPILSEEDLAAVRLFASRIDASASMEQELQRLAGYLRYRDGNAASVIEAFLKDCPESVHRKEGKEILEKFRQLCLS